MQQILVTAATGNVGAPLVEALQEKNMNFTATTRNEEKARDKLGSAVDTVFMDYEQPESLGPALKGHNILFLSGASDMPHAEQLLIPMVEKAWKQDIAHIVFIATYPKLAKAVKESGIDYTGIAPNFFMENFALFQTGDIRDRHQLFLPGGDGKASFVHSRDISEVVAEVLSNPSNFKQKTLPITGPETLDLFEAAKIFTEVLGVNITYKNPPD